MDTLQESKPKARKDHKCNYCDGEIPKGEVYSYSTHVYEGDIYSWKSHLKCQEIASELRMFNECEDGVTGDDFHEIINDVFFDNLASDDQTFKNTSFQQRLKTVQDKFLTPKNPTNEIN